jgi:hypothetical protein
MDSAITLICLAGLAIWCYRDGKRIGSRLGYRAGRNNSRRKKARQR